MPKISRKRRRYYKPLNPVKGLGVRRVWNFPFEYYGTFDTTADNAINAIEFYSNGASQPKASGATHQPFGWDQIKVNFKRYIVVRSFAKVNVWTVPYGSNPSPLWINLEFDNDQAAPPGGLTGVNLMQYYEETNPGRCRIVDGLNRGRAKTCTLTKSYAIKKSAGKAAYDEDEYGETGSFNTEAIPGADKRRYFVINYANAPGTTNATTWLYNMRIVYTVLFEEPVQVVGS